MRRLLVVLALGGLLLAGCGGTAGLPRAEPAAPAPTTVPVAVVAEPTHLSVPAIQAESDLRAVGLVTTDKGQEIDIPLATEPMQGAWWSGSPRPGAVGPAIILGHVDGQIDGKAGQPGLFYRLKSLKSGDRATVMRADGTTAQFVIYEVLQVDKANFPAQRIYGNTTGPELRLITCGGEWDPVAHSYRSNWIALARLDPSSAA